MTEREEQTKKPGESQTVVALFKMCTGTPHCGSGVQAADELLIPTSSSVLMFPFSTQPSPHSPPLISPPHPSLPPSHSSAVCGSLRRRQKRQRQRGRSPILDGVCRSRAAWTRGSVSREPKQTAAGLSLGGWEGRWEGWGSEGMGGGCMSGAGQTRSIIRERGKRGGSTQDPIRGANSLSSLRHIPARQKAVEEADNVHVWA